MMLGLLILAALAAAPEGESTQSCSYDPAILDLGVHAFDQDPAAGWRKLAHLPGCDEAAADLIERYRINQEGMLPVLYWHEGQLRAMAGQVERAIELMEKSKRPDTDYFGWVPYVDATVAFLAGDKAKLLEARRQLAAMPRPSSITMEDSNGQASAAIAWPPNLDVVDGLIACFGEPYFVAYGGECRPRPASTTPSQ